MGSEDVPTAFATSWNTYDMEASTLSRRHGCLTLSQSDY